MTPYREKLVEKRLRADIRWSVKRGLNFDPEATGRQIDDAVGLGDVAVRRLFSGGICGVCAISACAIRGPARGDSRISGWDVVEAASRNLEISTDDAAAIYYGVTRSKAPGDDASSAVRLAWRIRCYGLEYSKKHREEATAKRKRAGYRPWTSTTACAP